MEITEFLTIEPMSRRFKSPFDLVNYAIRLAEQALRTGRGSLLAMPIQNLAQQILLEILNHKDAFVDQAIAEAAARREAAAAAAKAAASAGEGEGDERSEEGKTFHLGRALPGHEANAPRSGNSCKAGGRLWGTGADREK